MKIGAVTFDLSRFGGIQPLAPPGRSPPALPGAVTAVPGPSGPSGPSKKPLFIKEGAHREVWEKGGVRETIEIAGTTRTTGTTGVLSPAKAVSAFRYAAGAMEFGDVCEGWTPESWAHELKRKADRCEAYRPDIARHYRRWAGDIEARLRAT